MIKLIFVFVDGIQKSIEIKEAEMDKIIREMNSKPVVTLAGIGGSVTIFLDKLCFFEVHKVENNVRN